MGDNAYLCMTYKHNNNMTSQQGRELNKAKAKMFSRLVSGQNVTIDSLYGDGTTAVVKIMNIRDPKTSSTYTRFKLNVQVVSFRGLRPVWDNGRCLRDENGRLLKVEGDIRPSRSNVNSYNRAIRREVERMINKYAPMFSIETWLLEVDRIIW
jgi:hypothetical protein